ncbi:MAG: 30S ribosomal protein S3 [Alkaliphilus sp.]
MGQKVNPHGLRVGIIKDWDAKWYANKKDFSVFLKEDYDIRKYIKKKLFLSGISKTVIERAANNRVRVSVHTAKPGMVIGKGGQGVEELKNEIEKMTNKKAVVNVVEIRRPDVDAQLVAENIAFSLERRISFRRAMKQAMQRAMRSGAKGIKVLTAGRLGGAEMARSEGYNEGNVPLHTLRANIDYGFHEANTTYGKLGIKVWIYKGEVLPGQTIEELEAKEDAKRPKQRDRRPRKQYNK